MANHNYLKLHCIDRLGITCDCSFYRVEDPTEEVSSIYTDASSQFQDESREANRTPPISLRREEPQKLQEMKEKHIFFRIWFGLKKREMIKIFIGSSGAALAGISKPMFGYFIITIGVAYYKSDREKVVGKYSILFASVGFLSFFAHTLQHYFYGLVGEQAMTNLRQALYSGIIFSFQMYFASKHEDSHDNHTLSCSYSTK